MLATSADQLKAGGPGITVGTGPFELTDYTPDQEIVYTRNADYAWGPHDAGAPQFETLRVDILPEASVRVGVVESGEADLASQLPPNLAADLGDRSRSTRSSTPASRTRSTSTRSTACSPTRACARRSRAAIDIDTSVEEIFFGQFPRAWSDPRLDDARRTTRRSRAPGRSTPTRRTRCSTRPAGPSATPTASARRTAQRLSARWIAWTPVPDDRAALANAIQSDLKAVGFDLVREVLEPGAYNEQYGPKTFDLTDWGFSGVDPDLLRSHLHTDGFQNASQVSDPELDALLEQGVATTRRRRSAPTSTRRCSSGTPSTPRSCRCTARR